MNIELVKCGREDLELIWKMQLEAFAGLLEKYQDYSTSPGAEDISKIKARFEMERSYFYFIVASGVKVGVIRIVDASPKRISPIFVMSEYRNKGYAQDAIAAAEEIYGNSDWKLETILEEKGNCHLYEKVGYVRKGEPETVNDRMHLVVYEK